MTKGVLSNFALGLYHWLNPAPMGIILQLCVDRDVTIQSVGRCEVLKGPAVPDLTHPTFFVTQDALFAWDGLSVAKHRAQIPYIAASVAAFAL